MTDDKWTRSEPFNHNPHDRPTTLLGLPAWSFSLDGVPVETSTEPQPSPTASPSRPGLWPSGQEPATSTSPSSNPCSDSPPDGRPTVGDLFMLKSGGPLMTFREHPSRVVHFTSTADDFHLNDFHLGVFLWHSDDGDLCEATIPMECVVRR